MQDHPYVGVDAIIVNDEGKVLLEKRANVMDHYPNYWCLPGGWMEWGEKPFESLKRECREELGIEVEVIRFVGRYYTKLPPSLKTRIALPHICKIISGIPSVNQKEEVSEVDWFLPEEVRKLNLAYDHFEILEDEGII